MFSRNHLRPTTLRPSSLESTRKKSQQATHKNSLQSKTFSRNRQTLTSRACSSKNQASLVKPCRSYSTAAICKPTSNSIKPLKTSSFNSKTSGQKRALKKVKVGLNVSFYLLTLQAPIGGTEVRHEHTSSQGSADFQKFLAQYAKQHVNKLAYEA
jgi:hypothetical protein